MYYFKRDRWIENVEFEIQYFSTIHVKLFQVFVPNKTATNFDDVFENTNNRVNLYRVLYNLK